MEKWIFDSPDQAGEAFRQFIKQFYQGNGFVNGGIEIGGARWTWASGHADPQHLRRAGPPGAAGVRRSALQGTGRHARTTPNCRSKGGHIGIYVSSRAQREVPGTIHDWLAKRAR